MKPSQTTSPDFIGGLVSGLEPVRPARAGRMIALALLVEVCVVAAAAWMRGLHMVDHGRIADPAFAGLVAILAAGAAASAATMATLSFPGRTMPPAVRTFVLALPPAIAVLLVAFSPWGGSFHGFVAVVVEGFGCTRNTIIVATPAWIAGLLLLRRLAPLDPLRVGLFTASSALLTAALAVQMACPNCDSWHMALSHYVPLLVAAWVAAMLSPLVLAPGRRN